MDRNHASDRLHEKIADIRAPLLRLIDDGHVTGGTVLAWHRGQMILCIAEGSRDTASTAPMTRDTLVRIASMTKPITSLAMLMMIEAGDADLQSPIREWMPEFADPVVLLRPGGPLGETRPVSRPITIEDLLTHRAGLSYAFNSSGPLAAAYEERLGPLMVPQHSPDRWVERLAALPLAYDPGSRFHYSHATDLLGFLISRIAGRPFRDVLLETVLLPLGMKDTDFWASPEKRGRLAQLCQFNSASDALEPVPLAQPAMAPDFCGGGGGLISTADDYLTFARLMLNGGAVDDVRLLKPETIRLMTANRLTSQQRLIRYFGRPLWETHGFGLGVSTLLDAGRAASGEAPGTFGWPGIYGTHWQADPANDLITLFLTQTLVPTSTEAGADRASLTRIAYEDFQRRVYASLVG